MHGGSPACSLKVYIIDASLPTPVECTKECNIQQVHVVLLHGPCMPFALPSYHCTSPSFLASTFVCTTLGSFLCQHACMSTKNASTYINDAVEANSCVDNFTGNRFLSRTQALMMGRTSCTLLTKTSRLIETSSI